MKGPFPPSHRMVRMTTGFGRDLSCRGRLVTTRMVGGVALLVDSIVRRLSTPRGTLHGGDEESAYGIDLAAYVGAVGVPVALAAMPSVVESELLKDPRIAAAVVTTSQSATSDGIAIEVRIRVTPASELATFDLTLAVSAVTVELIGGMP